MHAQGDHYIIQVRDSNGWKYVERVTKNGAAKVTRNLAKRTGKSHRVINHSKNDAVYVECDPS